MLKIVRISYAAALAEDDEIILAREVDLLDKASLLLFKHILHHFRHNQDAVRAVGLNFIENEFGFRLTRCCIVIGQPPDGLLHG